MLLPDAIEAWGQQHRDELDGATRERLAGVWTTIRRSPQANVDIETMSKQDAQAVMALFDAAERKEVSSTLNAVRRWSIARGAAPDPAAAAPPVPAGPTETPETPAAPAAPAAGTNDTPVVQAVTPAGEVVPPPAPPGVAAPPGAQGPVPQITPPVGMAADEPDSIPKPLLIGIAVALLALIIYFVFIRDSDDDGVATNTGFAPVEDTNSGDQVPEQGSNESAGDGFAGAGRDICSLAQQFDADDTFVEFDFTDGGAFFDQLVNTWDQVAAVAPPEIAGDVAILRAETAKWRDLSAQYGHNVTDAGWQTAVASFDTTALLAASDNVTNHVEQTCGISLGSDPSDPSVPTDGSGVPAFDDLTDPEAEAIANSILAGLGITPELAECLQRELGDIDSAAADPSLLTKPVCDGKSLFDILSGING